MRVYELAHLLTEALGREVKSAEVIAALQAAGSDCDHASEVLTDAEAATARAALAGSAGEPAASGGGADGEEGAEAEGDVPGAPAPVWPEAPARFQLVRKAGLHSGDVRCERGGVITAEEHAGLPPSVQAYFDAVA